MQENGHWYEHNRRQHRVQNCPDGVGKLFGDKRGDEHCDKRDDDKGNAEHYRVFHGVPRHDDGGDDKPPLQHRVIEKKAVKQAEGLFVFLVKRSHVL